MTEEIILALDKLEIWDADAQMDIEYVKSSPLYSLLEKINVYDSEILNFILYNTCQRVIPSWEINCNNKVLRPALFEMRNYLKSLSNKGDLLQFNEKIKSPKFDCTYSDTSGASGTIFNSIKAILEGDLIFATYAISDADIANTGKEFDKWFKEVLIPISFDKQFCDFEQTTKFTYEEYKSSFQDLFEQISAIF